jgi:hypothetical protein
MKKVYVFLSVVIPILVISSLIWRPTVTHASFNSNNVMDDIVFTNVNSMGESAIQNFLNRWPSGCLTNYQAPYPVDYFTFGGNVSAASVIYRAAQYWGLNPQVILATLQKESSVVTGDASYGCQYINTAMGYDCPDAGSCPVHASNLGFSQQVMHAAWQLRFNQERSYGNIGWDGDSSVYYYGYMTQGNRARVQGGSTIYYDGTATIDGTLVYMSNGATASLYSYTPHFHGNQNFYSLFNSWFGDTIYHGVPYAHPNGTLVRNSNELQVYLIENGQRLPVPTAESLFSFNYNFGDIRFANYYDDQMPVVSPLPLLKEGTVFKGSGPAIYTYRIVAGIPQKQHFPTWETFTGLGYRLQDVMTVPDWEIPSANYASDVDSSQHPVGALVQPAGHLEVYYLYLLIKSRFIAGVIGLVK